MIKTLREIQENLSELVDAASRGEDVLITVEGKVKARLTKAEDEASELDKRKWIEELEELRKAVGSGKDSNISTERIFEQMREDRS
jgi:prevent-host-death family protein